MKMNPNAAQLLGVVTIYLIVNSNNQMDKMLDKTLTRQTYQTGLNIMEQNQGIQMTM
jgi:hypothetical protein